MRRYHKYLLKRKRLKRVTNDHARVLEKIQFRPWFLKRTIRKHFFIKTITKNFCRTIFLKKKIKQKNKKAQSVRLAYKYAFCKFLLLKRIPSVIISDRFKWVKLFLQ